MKHARDMDETERTAALKELIRGAKPVPPTIITEADQRGNESALLRGSSNPSPPPTQADARPKMARDMSEEERGAWLKENMKRTR
jgi:hypothetical protein